MQKILSLVLLSVAMTCGSTQMVETQAENITSVAAPDGPEGLKAQLPKMTIDSTSKAVAFTDVSKVGEIMGYLASDELQGRDSGSEGIEKAAQYIEKYFEANGVSPYYKTYRDSLSNYENAFNVIGIVEGNDPILKNEYILIGAHYDHIGIVNPENGDTIANGANDNASGTTSVLEIARYFGTKKTNKRSLLFALFSAEEKGLLGSKHLAKRMKGENLNLYTMLNFEMTGVPLINKDYDVYITGYLKSNLAEICNGYAGKKLIGFLPTAKQYNLFFRSDNYPFHSEFGVPSHTFCTFDFTNFKYYHKPDDEVSEVDLEHMTYMVNELLPVIESITNAPTQEIKLNKK